MKGKKTLIIAILTFAVGLISYLTDSDLWGLLPVGSSNTTEILIMVQSAIMTILRVFTTTPILKTE